MKDRLTASCIGHITALYDMANAFCSVDQSEFRTAVEQTTADQDPTYFEQRLSNATARLGMADNKIELAPGEGVLMGTSEGPKLFNKTYVTTVKSWNRKVFDKRSIARPAGEGPPVDGSISVFAAGTTKIMISNEREASATATAVRETNAQLDPELELIGMKQNKDKTEVVPCLGSATAHKDLQRGLLEHQVRTAARHLGGVIVWNGSSAPEIRRRLDATDKAWW